MIQSDIGIIHCLPGILIYQNPVSATAKIGDQHVFSVETENAASYQWQIKVNSGEWVDYIGTDSTYSNIRIRVADFPQYSTQLRCKLTGLNGTVLYTDGGYIF